MIRSSASANSLKCAGMFLLSILYLISCKNPLKLDIKQISFPKDEKGEYNLWSIEYINNSFYGLSADSLTISSDGEKWQIIPISDDKLTFTGIAYGKGIFILTAGKNGKGIIYTSNDGKAWKKADIPETKELQAVTFGNDRFVAVGQEINIIMSADGEEWIRGATNLTERNTFNDVLFENKLFVAVGTWGVIATSDDGLQWKGRESGTNRMLNGIAYGNGRFVAVSNAVTISDARTVVSTDGVSWKSVDSDIEDTIYDIAFGNDIFVAVGGNYRKIGRSALLEINNNNRCIIYTSRDGKSWKENKCGTTKLLESVAYGDDIFLAVGPGIMLRAD